MNEVDYNSGPTKTPLAALSFGPVGAQPTAVEKIKPLPIGLYTLDGQTLLDPAAPTNVNPATLTCLGDEFLSNFSSAVGLGTIPANAKFALLQAEGANIRFRCKGGAAPDVPTASIGMLLQAGDSLPWNASLSALRFFPVTNGAKLNVLYFG